MAKFSFWRLVKSVFTILGHVVQAVFVLMFLAVTIGIFVALDNSGGNKMFQIEDRSILVLNPEGQLVESAVEHVPFEFLRVHATDRLISTHALIKTIERAAGDERIERLIIRLEGLQGLTSVSVEMLGEALRKFRESGKSSIAYGHHYEQNQYLLASYADKIALHPMGVVLIGGFGYHRGYFADMLEKLGIEVHLFRAGAYKSAAEFLIRNDMSEEERVTGRTIISNLWQSYQNTLVSNRGLKAADLDRFIEQPAWFLSQSGGNAAQMAKRLGWVDELMTETELRSTVIQPDDTVAYVSYEDYANSVGDGEEASGLTGILSQADARVGLIVAEGAITDVQPERGEIAIVADSLISLIEQARDQDGIKGLVVRLNTPGGSALASERIREALKSVQAEGKPVVISMGEVAASGGYWLSANADEIWASPTTVTGSIGVFSLIPTFEGTAKKIGMSSDGVHIGELAGVTLFEPLPDALTESLQANVNHIYQTFVELVAEGRELSVQDVRQVAGGKVWTGQAALDHRLVDHLGSLDNALAATARLANLQKWQVEALSERRPWWDSLRPLWGWGVLLGASHQFNVLYRFVASWLPKTPLSIEPGRVQALCLDCDAFVPLGKTDRL